MRRRFQAKFVSLGKRASQYLSRARKDLLANFTLPDKPTFSDIRNIVEFLLNSYEEGRIDTIEVLYTSFINTLRQEPELIRLFPLNDLDSMTEKLHERFGGGGSCRSQRYREILFEDRDAVLSEVASLYLKRKSSVGP